MGWSNKKKIGDAFEKVHLLPIDHAFGSTDNLVVSRNSRNPQAAEFALIPAAVLAGASLWGSTAPVTLGNSAVAATLLGTGVGSKTIPVEALIAGGSFVLEADGVISTHSTPGTLTLILTLGAKVLATKVLTLAASLVGDAWKFRGTITVETAGSSGVVNVGGVVQVYSATPVVASLNARVTATDMSVDRAINLTGTWSAAHASNTVTNQSAALSRRR